jgi:hypothetical protein
VIELTKDSTGAEIRQAWVDSGIEVQAEFWRLHLEPIMSYDAMHGKLWRTKLNITPRPELFQHAVGEPLKLSGDWIVLGDVQLPTTDYDFAILPAAIAKRHLSKPRQLLIVGDLMNMDCFASYEKEVGLPSFRQEIESARVIIMEWYKVFDRIVWLPGNHERRASRNTSAAIMMEDLAALINARVETSNLDHAIIETPNGEYRAVHGSDYGINQLTVADSLASKYRQHIISFHEHHCAMGYDRYGHNLILNGGGLFNQWYMAYTRLNTNKRANMKQGFVMLKGGYPYLFGKEPFTRWDDWLSMKVSAIAERAA